MPAPLSAPPNLGGQVAVVTGGAQGIGRAIALALAREHADVAIIDILNAEDTCSDIRKLGRRALSHRADVSSRDEIREASKRILREFQHVDILVTSAGVAGSATSLGDVDETDWQEVVDVNLKGTFLSIQAFFEHFVQRSYGKIVCIGSISGRSAGLVAGPQYAASKGGVHALARWVAKRGAVHSIYANVIAPGPIRTSPEMSGRFGLSDDLSPLGRLGEPADVAEAAVFLSSSASNWITGTILDLNGGILIA